MLSTSNKGIPMEFAGEMMARKIKEMKDKMAKHEDGEFPSKERMEENKKKRKRFVGLFGMNEESSEGDKPKA